MRTLFLKDRVDLAANALYDFFNKTFAKKANIPRSKKTQYITQTLNMLIELFIKGYYAPMARVEDLLPYIYVLDQINLCSKEANCKQFNKLINWASNANLKIDKNDPYDLIRLILDASIEACIGLTFTYKDKPTILASKLGGNLGLVSLKGYCDVLRGISDLAATQFQHDYLFHLNETIKDLYRYFKKLKHEVDLEQILKLSEDEWEKLRVFITSKFQPTAKAFLQQVLLLKLHWPLPQLSRGIKEAKGFVTRKPVEPTYLGRITSEIIDAMMYRYYDETVLQGYDIIAKSYFYVLKELAKIIEKGFSAGYLETLPSMKIMEEEINNSIENMTNIASQYFKRRGILRLGEVKQDAKDYVSQLYYLNKLAIEFDLFNPFSNISKYDIIKIITLNTLEI